MRKRNIAYFVAHKIWKQRLFCRNERMIKWTRIIIFIWTSHIQLKRKSLQTSTQLKIMLWIFFYKNQIYVNQNSYFEALAQLESSLQFFLSFFIPNSKLWNANWNVNFIVVYFFHFELLLLNTKHNGKYFYKIE